MTKTGLGSNTTSPETVSYKEMLRLTVHRKSDHFSAVYTVQ